jgi:hypothetical protein
MVGDVTKEDFLYIGAIIEQYNTFVDILILVVIIMLVCYCFVVKSNLYMWEIELETPLKKYVSLFNQATQLSSSFEHQCMMVISSMLVICIIIYTVRRIYFTIKADFQCVMNANEIHISSGKTNELLNVESVIDTTTKLRIITSFMYYYILTFLGSLLWTLVVFLTLYLIYLLIQINIECHHFVEPFNTGFGVLTWIWPGYKIISIPFALILLVVALFIKIPLTFYKKREGEYGNWIFDILNRIKDIVDNKVFSYIYVLTVLPGVVWYIESKAKYYVNLNFIRKLFYDSSHIQMFKFLDFQKTARLHLQIFVTGFIVALTYAIFTLYAISEPCTTNWIDLNKRFVFGYFMSFTMVIVLYLIAAGRYIFEAFLSYLNRKVFFSSEAFLSAIDKKTKI